MQALLLERLQRWETRNTTYITDIANKQYIIGNEDTSSPEGFELFIEDALLTGAWYSVEQYDPSKNDNMVFTYEINRKSEIFDDFISAFKYLIEINPGVEEKLLAKKSRILNIH